MLQVRARRHVQGLHVQLPDDPGGHPGRVQAGAHGRRQLRRWVAQGHRRAHRQQVLLRLTPRGAPEAEEAHCRAHQRLRRAQHVPGLHRQHRGGGAAPVVGGRRD